jgi:adenine-specific DNA-methyltransferase
MNNCFLQYPGKASASELAAYQPQGQLKQLRNHQSENCLYLGDNLPILSLLQENWQGKIDLVYIDPPFGTGQTFAKHDEAIAYEDQAPDHRFLEFLRRRLWIMRDLLSDRGSIYLHIDKKIGHYVKLIMDEVFGYENHLNDLTRIKCNPKNFSRKAFGNYSDMVLYYAKKRDEQIWEEQLEPLSETEIQRLFPKTDPQRGPYTTHPLHAPGVTQNGDTGQPWKGMEPPPGRHWRYGRKVLDELDEKGLIEWSHTGNPRKKVFAKDHKGKKIQDVWEFKDRGLSFVSYPTEKNHALLERIIRQSSLPDSWVLDAFAGSGSTLLLASKWGRRWIGIDESEQARTVIEKNLADRDVGYQLYEYDEF